MMDSATKDKLKSNILGENKMKDPALESLEERIIEFRDYIQEECLGAIRALDNDEMPSAAFRIGQIYGAADALSESIKYEENDD